MVTLRDVCNVIEAKADTLLEQGFFGLLADTTIAGRDRLAFAPAMYHYIMMFPLILRALRRDEPRSVLDGEINKYCDEDAGHWAWYLRDMEKLGYDKNKHWLSIMSFSSDLYNFKRLTSFDVANNIIRLADSTKEEIGSLVIIFVFESVGLRFLTATQKVTEEMGMSAELDYFGDKHLEDEKRHSCLSSEFYEIELADIDAKAAFNIIESMMCGYENLFNYWLASVSRYRL